jgi:hypothetical protein
MAGFADLMTPTDRRGIFGQEFGQEFDPNELLSLVVPQLRAQSQQTTADIGAFTRTRGLSGAQEAELFSRAGAADAGAMAQASLQAEQAAAEAANRERLVNEAYQFQIKAAEEDQLNRQKEMLAQLIGGGVGAAAGIATSAIGAPSTADIYKYIIEHPDALSKMFAGMPPRG